MIKAIKDIGYNATAVSLLTKSATISYTDSSTALFSLPIGARVLAIIIDTVAGFNGTTPTYSVGYTGTTTAILNGATLPATATTRANSTSVIGLVTTAEPIVGTFTGGGTNTAGTGVLTVLYTYSRNYI